MKKLDKKDKEGFYTFVIICVVMIVFSFFGMYNCRERHYLDDYCYEQKGTYKNIKNFLKETEKRKNIQIDAKAIEYLEEKYSISSDTLFVKIWVHEHLLHTVRGPRSRVLCRDLSAISVNGEIIEEHSWLSHHTTDLVMMIVFGVGFIALVTYRIRCRDVF